MKVIYKYPFETSDSFTLEMPKGAEILALQTQRKIPCIWALIDRDFLDTKVERTFYIYGTGHWIGQPGYLKYIGTYQEFSGSLIWHLFEEIKK